MAVRFVDDKSKVDKILSALADNGGYCPCQIERNESTKCACKDFRDKIRDPSYHGECICGLYIKE